MTAPFRLSAALCGLLAMLPQVAHADAANGQRLAGQWCAGCHVVGAAATAPVPQGPPSFPALSRSGMSAARMRAFLTKPHGKMPDLSLSRSEIADLVDYIQSLR